MQHRRRGEPGTRTRGFTLIEAVTAVVVLAIAVPPILIAIHDAHYKRANPILALRARWLAEEKLEDIIADRHSASRGYEYLIEGNYLDEDVIPGFPGLSRTVTLTETLADLTTPGDGYMKVRVDVSWIDAQSVPRTLALETVLTEYGP